MDVNFEEIGYAESTIEMIEAPTRGAMLNMG